MHEVKRVLTIALLYVTLLAMAVAVLGGCRSATTWQQTTNNEETARKSCARDTVTKQLHDTITVRETSRYDTTNTTLYKTLQIIRHENAHEAARHDTTIIIQRKDTSITATTRPQQKDKQRNCNPIILFAAAAAAIGFFVIIVVFLMVKQKKKR